MLRKLAAPPGGSSAPLTAVVQDDEGSESVRRPQSLDFVMSGFTLTQDAAKGERDRRRRSSGSLKYSNQAPRQSQVSSRR